MLFPQNPIAHDNIVSMDAFVFDGGFLFRFCSLLSLFLGHRKKPTHDCTSW